MDFDRSRVGGFVAMAAIPPCPFKGSRWRDTVLMRVGCNWTLRWGDGDGGSIGGQGEGHVWVKSSGWIEPHPECHADKHPALLSSDCLFDMSSWAVTQRAAGSFCSPPIPRSLVLTSHYPHVPAPPLRRHTWGRTKPQQLNTCAHLHAAINGTVNNYFLQIDNEILTGR